MSLILLSILTPTIPGRRDQLTELERQIRESTPEEYRGQVQHLSMCDNRVMSIGKKREALVRAACGLYVAFVDDDDWVAPDYVSELCAAIDDRAHTLDEYPDVITFEQDGTYNGQRSTVEFKLGNPNGLFNPGGKTLRAAWHVCAWRRKLAVRFPFPDTNYGEDWGWAFHLNAVAKRSQHIPKILHYYRHDATTTAAPEPLQPNLH